MQITAIVAHDRNKIIGNNGKLPWHIPSDLKWFKEYTTNKPVVMGRKTAQSLNTALPNRTNIVLSTNGDLQIPSMDAHTSIKSVLRACKGQLELCVIGGSQIYSLFESRITQYIITAIDTAVDGDTFFTVPNLIGFYLVKKETVNRVDENTPGYVRFTYQKQMHEES